MSVLRDVIEFLACPHCGGPVTLADRAVRCGRGHSFDVARQGYVNLLPAGRGPDTGDSSAMVVARQAFLDAGHFAPIADTAAARAADTLAADVPGAVLDVGAGTGHYLAGVLDRVGGDQPRRVGLALDRSPYAARRAARAHPKAGAAVCDVWRSLPVRSGGAALVLNVFAPRNGAEMHRVLAPGGSLVVVSPTARHLAELVDALDLLTVDERKPERVDSSLRPHLVPVRGDVCEFVMSLSHSDVEMLAGMGPSARHISPEDLRERIARLPEPMPVTASVTASVYRRAAG